MEIRSPRYDCDRGKAQFCAVLASKGSPYLDFAAKVAETEGFELRRQNVHLPTLISLLTVKYHA